MEPEFRVPSTLVLCITLIIICSVSTNNYFAYHAPSATAREFETYYQLDTQQFGTLFTIYSVPNIILVVFSGIFVDRYGVRFSSLIFNSLILLGVIACALTPFPTDSIRPQSTYAALLCGRFLVGLGGESITACAKIMLSKWYKNTGYLNTALAVNQAFVQLLGSSSAFYFLPRVASFALSQWVTVGVCAFSLLATVIYNHVESKYEGYLLDLNKEQPDQQLPTTTAIQATAIELPVKMVSETSALSGSANGILGVEAGIGGSGSHPRVTGGVYHAVAQRENEDCDDNKLPMIAVAVPSAPVGSSGGLLDALRKLPLLYWLLLTHVSLVSPILYTFTAFGPLYLQENFESTRSEKQAGDAVSLLYVAIVAAPFTGMLIDRVGYRAVMQLIATASIPVVFLLLTFEVLPPGVCMLCMGLAYSVTQSNATAMVAVVLPADVKGAGFGLIGCAISLALLVEPLAVGTLHDYSGSFTTSVWVFTIVTALGACIILCALLCDRVRGR